MKNPLIKGLFMAIGSLLSATFVANGALPSTLVAWEILGVTIVGTAVLYLVKNAVIPSVTILGTMSLQDFLLGSGVALGTVLVNWGTTEAISKVSPNWHQLLGLAGGVLISFVAKAFLTQNTGAPAVAVATAQVAVVKEAAAAAPAPPSPLDTVVKKP
jgi:hypothetical protein